MKLLLITNICPMARTISNNTWQRMDVSLSWTVGFAVCKGSKSTSPRPSLVTSSKTLSIKKCPFLTQKYLGWWFSGVLVLITFPLKFYRQLGRLCYLLWPSTNLRFCVLLRQHLLFLKSYTIYSFCLHFSFPQCSERERKQFWKKVGSC